MRLNEMLSNLINQNSVAVKSAGSVEIQQLPSNLAAQIRALVPGEILQGEVLDNMGDTVKLLIHMGGERIPLQARLEQNISLSVGRSLMFQVKNNGSSLSLSPLFENMGMEQNASKALETASLPINETTMNMTAKLMQEGISIDKNTLQEIYHEVVSNQNAELMDIIDLHKLKLPVTQENLAQVHSYKMMSHQLTAGVEQMSKDLLQLLHNLSERGDGRNIEVLLREVLQPVEEGSVVIGKEQLSSQKSPLPEQGITEVNIKETPEVASQENQQSTISIIHNNTEELQQMQTGQDVKNSATNIVTKELLLHEILTQVESASGDKETISKLLTDDSFQNKINEFLQRHLLLQPESADKDQVKELYTRLGKQLNHISMALEALGQEQSSLGKTVQNMNQNIQFLNQMNQMYAYVQLPLKLSEGNAHGELYVYSNKKHLASEDGEVSALLHLDMDHLGPVDIYVKMKDSNVNTNFYLADEDMLDFLYDHMDMLTSRLEKRGYHMTCRMTVRGEREEDGNGVFQELIRENSNIPTMVNYSFDVRA